MFAHVHPRRLVTSRSQPLQPVRPQAPNQGPVTSTLPSDSLCRSRLFCCTFVQCNCSSNFEFFRPLSSGSAATASNPPSTAGLQSSSRAASANGIDYELRLLFPTTDVVRASFCVARAPRCVNFNMRHFAQEVLDVAIETASHNVAAAKELLLSWGCHLAPRSNAANCSPRAVAACGNQTSGSLAAEAIDSLSTLRAATAEALSSAVERIAATAEEASSYATEARTAVELLCDAAQRLSSDSSTSASAILQSISEADSTIGRLSGASTTMMTNVSAGVVDATAAIRNASNHELSPHPTKKRVTKPFRTAAFMSSSTASSRAASQSTTPSATVFREDSAAVGGSRLQPRPVVVASNPFAFASPTSLSANFAPFASNPFGIPSVAASSGSSPAAALQSSASAPFNFATFVPNPFRAVSSDPLFVASSGMATAAGSPFGSVNPFQNGSNAFASPASMSANFAPFASNPFGIPSVAASSGSSPAAALQSSASAPFNFATFVPNPFRAVSSDPLSVASSGSRA